MPPKIKFLFICVIDKLGMLIDTNSSVNTVVLIYNFREGDRRVPTILPCKLPLGHCSPQNAYFGRPYHSLAKKELLADNLSLISQLKAVQGIAPRARSRLREYLPWVYGSMYL